MDQNSFMMAGNMPPQGMQRPQPGVDGDQLHAKVIEELRKMSHPQGTWHMTMDVRERANTVMQLQTQMRLVQPQNNPMAAVGMALKFETHQFSNCPSKDQYVAAIRSKINELHKIRQAQAQAMTPNMLGPQQNTLQISQQQAMAMQTPMQPSRSNQGEMANNVPPQLQQPFQSSPMNLPGQNQNMQANMQSNMQQNMQQNMPNMQQQHMQSNMNQQRRPMQFTPQEQAMLTQKANMAMSQVPKEKVDLIRRQLYERMTPEQRQANGSMDPLPRHFFQMVANQHMKTLAAQQAGQGNPQNMSIDPTQQMNPNMQRPASQQGIMSAQQGIDFASFAGQQADALKLQESGQLVVPASTSNGGSTANTVNNNNNNNNRINQNNNNLDSLALNMANIGQPNGMMMNANNNNTNQAQVQAMMAHRQQQMQQSAAMRNNQMQQQQQQAQVQARNVAQAAAQQQQMLRGQPGGLNATQPPQQSPAMSMLNRPMVPPGQQAGTTPQQAMQQLPPQPNGQMNPQMLAQMQQQSMNPNQAMFPPQKPPFQLPDHLPPHVKDKLMNMGEDQARIVLERLRIQSRQNQAQTQAQALQNNMNMPNAEAMNNMQNLSQPGSQQMPAMTNIQGLNQAQLQQKMLMQQRQHQQQQQQRMRNMDNTSFPAKLVEELQIAIPPNVQTWGQVKQFIHENQATLPQDLIGRLQKAQQVWAMKVQQAQAANANGGQMQGVPAATASGPPMMPGAPAPPAQMVPQQPSTNQSQNGMNMPANQPNMQNSNNIQVSPQEIAAFRNKMGAPNASDEQVRLQVVRWKMQRLQQDPNAFQQQKNAQRQAQEQAQQQALRQAQLQRTAQGHMQQQLQQQQPLQQQPLAGMAPQAPGMQPRSQQPPFNAQTGVPNMQGQKRPGTSDDVVEIPNPNQSPQRPSPANGQQNQQVQRPSLDQFRGMTPEQLSTLLPEERARLSVQMQQAVQQRVQTEALKRAQIQSQQVSGPTQAPSMQQSPPQQDQRPKQTVTVTDQHRIKAAQLQAQIDNSLKKGPPVQVDNESLGATINTLTAMLPTLHQLEKMMPFAVSMASVGLITPEILTRLCQVRSYFLHQMNKDGTINSYVSLELTKIEEICTNMKKATQFIMARMQQMRTRQDQPRPAQAQQHESAAQLQMPKQNQQLQQSQQSQQSQHPQSLQQRATENMTRSASQSGNRTKSKAPPAPTATAPPFPLGAPSPHGIPMYDGINHGLTPDKLQLPPQKKRKGNNGSAASTPANQGATPTPGGAGSPPIKMQSSPEQRRQQQYQVKLEQQQQDRRFKCVDEYCEFSIKGFESEDELRAHAEEAHKQIENPLDFFLNSAAFALDVDADGSSKHAKPESNEVNRGKQPLVSIKPQSLGPATIKKEALKVEGQTPGQARATVATPSPAFIKPSSPASGRTPYRKLQQQPVEPAASPMRKTMLETMAEKAGITLTVGETNEKRASASPVVGEDATGRDDSLNFMTSMADALSGFENPYGDENMDFGFSNPSPALTPSSSQSGGTETTVSTTNINETDRMKLMFEWNPFNINAGVAYDFSNDIGMGTMGLQSSFDGVKNPLMQEGLSHEDGTLESGQSKDNKENIDQQQQQPVTWDTMFYAGAGLDKNDKNWDKDAFGNSLLAGVDFFNV